MSRTTRSIVRRKARSGSLTVLCLLALMSAAPGSAPRAQSPAAGQDSGSAALLAASEAPVGLSLPVDWSLAGRLPAPDELLVVARPQDPAGTYASRSSQSPGASGRRSSEGCARG